MPRVRSRRPRLPVLRTPSLSRLGGLCSSFGGHPIADSDTPAARPIRAARKVAVICRSGRQDLRRAGPRHAGVPVQGARAAVRAVCAAVPPSRTRAALHTYTQGDRDTIFVRIADSVPPCYPILIWIRAFWRSSDDRIPPTRIEPATGRGGSIDVHLGGGWRISTRHHPLHNSTIRHPRTGPYPRAPPVQRGTGRTARYGPYSAVRAADPRCAASPGGALRPTSPRRRSPS